MASPKKAAEQVKWCPVCAAFRRPDQAGKCALCGTSLRKYEYVADWRD